jgi:1-acyl-sn-glycerol-3-phosphate acyltransferase
MLHHMGGRIQVHGEPARIPHMLVSNHLSYVDILVLLSQGCWTIVAKAEIARWPLMGAIARSVGTVFIDRSKRSNLARVNREIAGILGSGRSILVFPEGTSSGGAAVLPFKPALFEVAVDTACPVNIAVLGYRTGPGLPPAQEVVCWWRDMTFPDHLYRLLRLPGFQATVSFGASSISEPDRKSYARRAHAAVSELFVPVFPQG